MKRVVKWPLFLIAIPWALLLLLVQTVHGGGMARGGDPAIGATGLDGGGMGGLTASSAGNPAVTIRRVVTDLTVEQQARLDAASTNLSGKMSEWQTSSQAALRSLSGDAYNAELFKQNLLREDILNDGEIAMVAILNPDQAEKWESSQLNNQLNTRLGALGLSDAQKAKINPLVADTAKKLAAAKDKEALAKVRVEFWKQIASLLTDIQYTQLFAPTFSRGRGRGTTGGGFGTGGLGGSTPQTTPATRPN